MKRMRAEFDFYTHGLSQNRFAKPSLACSLSDFCETWICEHCEAVIGLMSLMFANFGKVMQFWQTSNMLLQFARTLATILLRTCESSLYKAPFAFA
jgi:hypothetical protein